MQLRVIVKEDIVSFWKLGLKLEYVFDVKEEYFEADFDSISQDRLLNICK